MKNSFGNYVVQKALKISKSENKKKLIEHATKNVERLGEKKIVDKWKSILQQSDLETESNAQKTNQDYYTKKAYFVENLEDTQINQNSNSNNMFSNVRPIPKKTISYKNLYQGLNENTSQFKPKSCPSQSQSQKYNLINTNVIEGKL
jgi:hypothetical protein